jgi:hypothetical protein
VEAADIDKVLHQLVLMTPLNGLLTLLLLPIIPFSPHHGVGSWAAVVVGRALLVVIHIARVAQDLVQRLHTDVGTSLLCAS